MSDRLLAAVPRSGAFRGAARDRNHGSALRAPFSGARHGRCPKHVQQEDTE